MTSAATSSKCGVCWWLGGHLCLTFREHMVSCVLLSLCKWIMWMSLNQGRAVSVAIFVDS